MRSTRPMPAVRARAATPAGASDSTSISTSSSGTAQHISAWPRARIASVSAAGW